MPRRFLDRRAEVEIEAMLAREELARSKQDEPATGDQAQAQRNAAPKKGGVIRRGAADWQGLVEQRILDGMERGMFDNLRGAGQPLNLDEDRFVPDEYKLAFRMLRSTDLAPLWVELNKEIREDIARMQRFRQHVHAHWQQMSIIERAHRRNEFEKRVKEINSKILGYNIIAPSSLVHFALLLLDEELACFDHPADPAL